jgi:hypothetical protein
MWHDDKEHRDCKQTSQLIVISYLSDRSTHYIVVYLSLLQEEVKLWVHYYELLWVINIRIS